MSKQTLILKPDADGDYLPPNERYGTFICRSILIDFFTLPENKNTPIKLVLSDKETANSYQVHLKGGYDIRIHCEGRWRDITMTCIFDDVTGKLGLRRKKFWVSLYWEE